MGKAIRTLFIVMIVSLGIALFWNQVPIIKGSVEAVLNPSAGKLLDWSINIGMTIFAAIISLFITIVQKYTTDQETLREIKKEQKLIQAEMKNFKEHPEKLMELQKKQLSSIPKTMEITMRPIMYTSIPIILLFRWFADYFAASEAKVFGISWIFSYIILSMIFTTIFRKAFNVA
jgi:uncharacterized membrane protein (DUF106 family)